MHLSTPTLLLSFLRDSIRATDAPPPQTGRWTPAVSMLALGYAAATIAVAWSYRGFGTVDLYVFAWLLPVWLLASLLSKAPATDEPYIDHSALIGLTAGVVIGSPLAALLGAGFVLLSGWADFRANGGVWTLVNNTANATAQIAIGSAAFVFLASHGVTLMACTLAMVTLPQIPGYCLLWLDYRSSDVDMHEIGVDARSLLMYGILSELPLNALMSLVVAAVIVAHEASAAVLAALVVPTIQHKVFEFTSYRLEHAQRELHIDALTGVANRRSFQDVAPITLVAAQSKGRGAALLMIDIDNFKMLNDSHGHNEGDVALRAAAKSLQGIGVHGDVYRYGGEEFAVVLHDDDVDVCLGHAELLRAAAADALEPWRTTISIGLTIIDPNETLIAAVQRADRALYQSKASGKNRVTLDERLDSKRIEGAA